MSRWDDIDWTLRDTQIARQIGVSRERVRQVRKKRGIPKVQGPGAPSIPHAKTVERIDLLRRLNTEAMTLAEIGTALGVSYVVAIDLVQKAGVPYRSVKGKPRKYEWDEVDWANLTNRQVAEQVGCTPAVAASERSRKGHPKGPDGRTVNAGLVWSDIDWSLSTMEIVRLTGMSQPAVSKARQRYAPETLHEPTLRAWRKRRGD